MGHLEGSTNDQCSGRFDKAFEGLRDVGGQCFYSEDIAKYRVVEQGSSDRRLP